MTTEVTAGVTAEAVVPEEHLARERVQRVLYISIGIGGLIFGLLHLDKILQQVDELHPGYAAVALMASVVMPASMSVIAWLTPAPFTHMYAKITVVVFVAAQFAWLGFMTVEYTASEPWLQGVNGIPAVLAAVAWHHRLVWYYAAIQFPLVALVEYVSTGGTVLNGLLNGVLSTMFAGILIGVSLAVVKAGDKQDQAAAMARKQASIESTTRTREREQARINGIVHDEVMSALLVAGREENSPRAAAQAAAALASIQTLSTPEDDAADYTPVGVISALRAAADDPQGKFEFWHTNVGNKTVPAEVMSAMNEAVTEAVRNSIQHGGDEDGPVHRLVRVDLNDDALRVVIQDSGRGFNVNAIPERRLGIRVSINDRMRSLPRGHSLIESRPGRGTVVTLWWTRFA